MDAKRLLDTIAGADLAAAALTKFRDKRADEDTLTKRDEADLQTIIKSLDYVYNNGQTQAARVSSVTKLLKSYNMCVKAKKKNERLAPYTILESMWRV